MAFLTTTITDGEVPSRFELDREETTIGRHPDCSIVVEAGAVSRFHAKVVRTPGGFAVEDCGSRNGTYLNGQLISQSQTLRQGDTIRISEVEFAFAIDDVPEFVRGDNQMTFDGANFGILMVDGSGTEQISKSKVEFSSSADGLKMEATPEAKLAALMKINARLNGVLALDEVLPGVLTSLFEIFPAADRGFVVMAGPNDELIPRWVKTRTRRDESETIRISRTIINRVMSERESILSLDASEDSRFDSSQSIADFSIKSMICAPLVDSDGESFGALQIDSTRGRGQFREDDADLLAGIAAQAAIAINVAQMHERALAQKEVEQDLKLATEVQQAFLPRVPPTAAGFHVESFYQAAHHIGGDYYDYVTLPEGRVAIVVADVVGHGVAAAMFMAKLSAETRFCLASESNLATAISCLNDRMSRLEVERFVTFLVVVIDPSTDQIAIVNAGHMPPIVRRGDGTTDEPGGEESGLPIAILEDIEYESVTVRLDVGDALVMYTDGINEAMDQEDREFGIDALRSLTAQGGDAGTIKDRIVDAVRRHVGDAPPFDDMCLVVLEKIPVDADRDTDHATVRDTAKDA